MLKKFVYATIAREPIVGYLRRKLLTNRVIVLMYHELANDDDEIEAWTVVKRSSFISQIKYLRLHFDIVSLQEAICSMDDLSEFRRPMVVITFDDGDSGNARVLLPIVKSLQLPVTIFVATRQVQEQTSYWFDRLVNALQSRHIISLNLGQYGLNCYKFNRVRGAKNWAEIERLLSDMKTIAPNIRDQIVDELEKTSMPSPDSVFYRITPLTSQEVHHLAECHLVTIGAHSHCHNILTQISDNDAAESITTSKRLLESWTQKNVDHFAYPNGNHSDALARIVKEAGFSSALATISRPWERSDSLFRIPRIAVGRYDSLDRFKINLLGGLKRLTNLGAT